VDGLIDGLPHLFLGPRYRWVQFSRRPTIFGITPLLFILSAEVEPAKDQDDLLGHLSATDELIPLAHRLIDEVLIDLGGMRLPRYELRQTRRLLDRPGHLELFPVHRTPFPVRRGTTLKEHIAI